MTNAATDRATVARAHSSHRLDFVARRRARGPRAAGSARAAPGRRAAAREPRHRRSRRRPLRRPRRVPLPRRPARGEHVGHDPRCARRPPARRRAGRGAPLGHAAGRRVAGGGSPSPSTAAPRHPRRCPAFGGRVDVELLGGGDVRAAHARSPTRSACGWRKLELPRPSSPTTWRVRRARSATGTCPATGRSAATRRCSRASRAARRCRARAGRSPTSSSPTSSVAACASARSSCTPACRHSKAASAPTPSATAFPARPPT